jgi:hypothetical protein
VPPAGALDAGDAVAAAEADATAAADEVEDAGDCAGLLLALPLPPELHAVMTTTPVMAAMRAADLFKRRCKFLMIRSVDIVTSERDHPCEGQFAICYLSARIEQIVYKHENATLCPMSTLGPLFPYLCT